MTHSHHREQEMAKQMLKVWTWDDPADELHRYRQVMFYEKRPQGAPNPQQITLTFTLSKPKKTRRKARAS